MFKKPKGFLLDKNPVAWENFEGPPVPWGTLGEPAHGRFHKQFQTAGGPPVPRRTLAPWPLGEPRAKQSKARQSQATKTCRRRAEQSRAKQKQSKAEQKKAKQNRADHYNKPCNPTQITHKWPPSLTTLRK